MTSASRADIEEKMVQLSQRVPVEEYTLTLQWDALAFDAIVFDLRTVVAKVRMLSDI